MASVVFSSTAGLLLGILLGGPAQSTARSASAGAAEITVTATDYAFLTLPPMKAGPTVIGFVNQGKVNHEFALARLKSTTTVDQYLRTPPGLQRLALTEGIDGILIAQPGKSATGKLLVDLVKDGTYLVWCSFRDTPDAQPHIVLGMFASFIPR